MLTPNVRGNAGCYRAFSIDAPEGSILNCDKPLAVNLRTRTGWYIAPNIFRALSQAAPNQVQAFTGLPVAANVYGRDEAGDTYSDMLFTGGGQGGSAHGDGKSGLLYPTSAANTSIETFEARVPVLVVEKTYLKDSGGAGRIAAAWASASSCASSRMTACRPWSRSIPKGSTTRSPACSAASPGGGGLGPVIDEAGHVLKDVGTGELVQVTHPHEIVELVLAGGAGYGAASERSRDAVARDVALGLVSPEAAKRDYGMQAQRMPSTTLARPRPAFGR
jgi:5-oxoprolinase (ATP-hydrolysing)